MTEQEKILIEEYSQSIISKKLFVEAYPHELSPVYIQSVFADVYKDKNADDLEDSFVLLFFDPAFITSEKYVEILSQLLLEDWHYKHEDISLILQKIKSPKSINALYERALRKPAYMNYDDSYSLARKCIHALSDINTEESREKLRLLSLSDIAIIRQKAEKQLNKHD